MKRKKVIAVPDLHFPWHNAKALAKLYDAIANEKPDVVIQLGDMLDQYCFSRFSRGLDLMTPAQEICEGREAAEAFWKNVRKAGHSKMRMVQMLGNHDARVEKRIYDKFSEIASLVDLGAMYRFPNVETVTDGDRSEVVIDGVYYIHGWMTRPGAHMNYFNAPVVHGHTHRGGLVVKPRKSGVIFELDCGFLADAKAKPLAYSSTLTTHWNLGFGLVDQIGPRFCPIAV